MRKSCLDTIYDLAKIDSKILFIGSDLGPGVLDEFKKNSKPLTIKVWREGEEKLLSVTPVKACKSDIELIFDNSVI